MVNNQYKVEQFHNKNQFIIEGRKEVIFQSYNSTIAIYNYETTKLTLGCDWDYSRTTLKHLYLFLEEYAGFNFRGINNKKKALQNFIDNEWIDYNENLR